MSTATKTDTTQAQAGNSESGTMPVSREHRNGELGVPEGLIRASIPEVAQANGLSETLRAVLEPRARRVCEKFAGERQELARFIIAMLEKCDGEVADMARAAIVLNDLRLMRAVGAALLREEAHWHACGYMTDITAGHRSWADFGMTDPSAAKGGAR